MSDVLRLTRAELREIDRVACQEWGIPSSVLMENAGRGAAEIVLGQWMDPRDVALSLADGRGPSRASAAHRAAIFCGPGNNGGDGAVVARHLANAGFAVAVLYTEPSAGLRGDAALQRRILERMGLRVQDVSSADALAACEPALAAANVFVDGLLGTGFEGDVRPKIARVIERINALRRERPIRVVALDLPSGLDCDRGEPAQPTVVADLTATFVARKVGFDTPRARAVCGEVRVVSIGVPIQIVERVRGSPPAR